MSVLKLFLDHRKKSTVLEQIVSELSTLIIDQKLPSGYIFNNINELAKSNHIELNILIEALEILLKKHLVSKINDFYQVTSIVFKSGFFDEIMTFEQAIVDAGYPVSITTLEETLVETLHKDYFENDNQIKKYFKWDRVYYAENVPIIRVISFFPSQYFNHLDGLLISKMIQQRDDLKIVQSIRDIKSIIPNQTINESLNQPEDTPCLEFIYTNYNKFQKPVEYAVAFTSSHYAIFTQTSIHNPQKKDI